MTLFIRRNHPKARQTILACYRRKVRHLLEAKRIYR